MTDSSNDSENPTADTSAADNTTADTSADHVPLTGAVSPAVEPERADEAGGASSSGATDFADDVELPSGVLGRVLAWLARFQTSHPKWFLITAILAIVAAVPIAAQLTLKADFEALLPETAPSVVDLEQLIDRFGISSTLSVAVQGDDQKTAREGTRRLAKALRDSNDPDLISIDSGIADFQKFAEENKFLYADLKFLEQFQQDLHERVEFEAEQNNPLDLGLDDDLDIEEPPTIDDLRQRVEDEVKKTESALPDYPEGLFAHRELPLAVIFLRTSIDSSRLSDHRKLISRIEGHLSKIKQDDPEMAALHLDYGGDLMDTAYETATMAKQIAFATLFTLLAIMAVVYIFFRSWRAVPILGLCIIPPLAVTFAIAYLTVGFLNTSTAFLMSIVIGNGINPNVIWLARYFEERLAGYEPEQATRITHAATWRATMVASLAAGLAYASLMVTDFRGFRDFGIIGGIGMALCWLSAFILLPAIVVASEKLRPLRPERLAKLKRNPYGRFFAWLAFSRPKTAVFSGALITIASVGIVAMAIVEGPMEYDFRKLISVRPADNRIAWVNKRQGEIVDETTTGSALAILSPTRADAPKVKQQLMDYEKQNPGSLGPVRSIDSLLPQQQEAKVPIIQAMRKDLIRARKFASVEDKKKLDEHMPPDEIRIVGDMDLPEEVRRTFTERDGTVGRLVFSEHHLDRNGWDGKYMIEWAKGPRSVLIDGKRPPSTGNAMVFADILAALATEGPLAIMVALSATMLLLLVSLRRWRDRLLTLFALLGGILWMAATMALFRIKLNFLNFVAFPITFGNGVDYGVNVISRQVVEEQRIKDARKALRATVERTGGAVVLCSLTTIIGYLSLYISSNKALNSFGAAMAISEVTCVATAVLVMPSWLALKLNKAEKKGA